MRGSDEPNIEFICLSSPKIHIVQPMCQTLKKFEQSNSEDMKLTAQSPIACILSPMGQDVGLQILMSKRSNCVRLL